MKNEDMKSIDAAFKIYLKMQHDINNILQHIYAIDLADLDFKSISKNKKMQIKESCEVADKQINILKQLKDFFIQKSFNK